MKTQLQHVIEGSRIASIGTGEDAIQLPSQPLALETYRPFNLPGLVAVTLDNGQIIRGLVDTPVELAPARY